MKVLQINANYGFGSTGIIMRDIGKTLTSNGHEAFFAYQKSNADVDNGYVIGNLLDWKFHALFCRLLGGQGFYSRRATKKLCRHIETISPDIVHLHNLHSNYVDLGILLEYLAKHDIPTVITMHDCWYFTGKCFHYVDVGCEGYKNGCGNCPKKMALPASYIFDRSKKDLLLKDKALHAIPHLTFVGCSKWIISQAKDSILQDLTIKQVYNGVDTEIFKPLDAIKMKEKFGIDERYVVLGMANKWCTLQNEPLIKKVSELPNTVLMIIGCKEQDMRKLKEINPKIISLGYISDRHQLAMYYSMADVFVNLTLADTLPTVNMESICCGTPVITYDSCGSPELIDGDSGIVVPAGQHEEVIKAIHLSKKMDWSKCRQSGLRKFDKRYCYQQYIDIYESISME